MDCILEIRELKTVYNQFSTAIFRRGYTENLARDYGNFPFTKLLFVCIILDLII